MSEQLPSATSTAESHTYQRSQLTDLLDRYDEFSAPDAVKAGAAILAIALLRGDTPLAFEALIRNGCRDEDLKRFRKVVESRGFSDVGWSDDGNTAPSKDAAVLNSVQSLKEELTAVARNHDPNAQLARLPLLCRLEKDEFANIFSYLTLIELQPRSAFPKSTAAGYTWYLRGSLAAEGQDFSIPAGSLLNDEAISTLVGGEASCVCLHLPFTGNDLLQNLSNFGVLSAEVEWSRMIWKALQTVRSFDELDDEQLVDAVDAAMIVRNIDGVQSLRSDQRWRVLSIKKPQTGIRSLASLEPSEFEPLCPALLWTEEVWEGLVSGR